MCELQTFYYVSRLNCIKSIFMLPMRFLALAGQTSKCSVKEREANLWVCFCAMTVRGLVHSSWGTSPGWFSELCLSGMLRTFQNCCYCRALSTHWGPAWHRVQPGSWGWDICLHCALLGEEVDYKAFSRGLCVWAWNLLRVLAVLSDTSGWHWAHTLWCWQRACVTGCKAFL